MTLLFASYIVALFLLEPVDGLRLPRPSGLHTTTTGTHSETRLPIVPTMPATPIYIKTGTPGCAVEGSPGVNTTSKLYGPQNVPNVLRCQSQCYFTRGCVMYSWSLSTPKGTQCMLYTAVGPQDYLATDFTSAVVPGNTDMFFSDKYPSDGSSFCYSNIPIPFYDSTPNTTSTGPRPKPLSLPHSRPQPQR